jgi:predicted thioesterase
MGSGQRDVLATPALAALMEAAAQEAVAACLEENQQTVGTRLDLTHDAATPVGMSVTAEAELAAIEGRTLYFTLTARDEQEIIASGRHTRTLAATASLERLLQKKLRQMKK